MNVILVPVDFSEVTDDTLQIAQKLAAGCGAKLYIVHVESLFTEDLKAAPVQKPHRDYLVRLARADHQLVQGLAEDLRQRGCNAEALLARGYVVEKILDEARRLRADLIVMGSHGHGRLYDVFVGSTCQGVLHKAEVPVLVVPAGVTQPEPHQATHEPAER